MFDKPWYERQFTKLGTSPTRQKVWGFFGVKISYVYIVAGLALFLYPETRFMAVLAGASFILARGVATEILSHIFPSSRPYQVFDFMPLGGRALFTRVNQEHDSFPSGHSASLAAISLLFFQFIPVLGVISFLFTLLAGFARVLLGYHWPRDVIFGWAIGVLVSCLVYQMSPYLVSYLSLLYM